MRSQDSDFVASMNRHSVDDGNPMPFLVFRNTTGGIFHAMLRGISPSFEFVKSDDEFCSQVIISVGILAKCPFTKCQKCKEQWVRFTEKTDNLDHRNA